MKDGPEARPRGPIPIEEIRAARERIAGFVHRTPLLRLDGDDAPAEIYLKLENLQPVGSFKLRGASNAMLAMPRERLDRGVWTASAGNMAQGVAWQARRLGLRCTVVAPDHAPEAKLAPFQQWFEILRAHTFDGMSGQFIHPVSDPAVMAGNGTIALEILEDLPGVDALVVPYGGGGLSCGIASAIRALAPRVRVYACEVETAAPLAASLAAGAPTPIDYRASFVDGIGGPFVLPDMWPLASRLLDGSLVVSLAEVADAIRLLAMRQRVIAEGAGAAPVAAALAGKAGRGKVACIVSGGNVDPAKLAKILAGGMP